MAVRKFVQIFTQRSNLMTKDYKICPKCGCQIYDPFAGKTKIHDVEKCLEDSKEE
jgi:hypothetical protein